MTVDRDNPIVLRRSGLEGLDAPRVLLLHGMANNGRVWAPFLERTAAHPWLRGAQFWSAELPWRGGGRAEWNQRRTATQWLTDTLDLAAAEAGRIDLVIAHSYAATALLDVLCRDEAAYDISMAVFVAPFYRPCPDDFSWATISGLPENFIRTMEEGIRVVGGPRGNPRLRRAMAERVCEEIGPYGWAEFLRLYLRTPWMRTDQLRARAMVVAGDADPIAAPEESAALAAALPAARRHRIAGCGHFPMLERPALFAELIDQFCASDAVLEVHR